MINKILDRLYNADAEELLGVAAMLALVAGALFTVIQILEK